MTDADLVLGRLDPASFWNSRLHLDVDGAHRALSTVGADITMSAEETAVAAIDIIDAHMADAVRRVLSLAGADARDLSLVAFGGMGAVHAARQCSMLGMQRVLIPASAPAFSALGLLTADHVIDETRSLVKDWREVDVDALTRLADELRGAAAAKLDQAGVAPARRRYEWRLNLVYPGQTFDVPIPIHKPDGEPITRRTVAAAAEELHRRNEAARLIEARSQEPVVRGIRLIATGLVEQPALAYPDASDHLIPSGYRRVYAGRAWFDEVPVYPPTRSGPARGHRAGADPEPVHDHRPGRRGHGPHPARRRHSGRGGLTRVVPDCLSASTENSIPRERDPRFHRDGPSTAGTRGRPRVKTNL